MTLQIEVTKISVKDAGNRFQGKLLKVTLNLTCWSESIVKEYPVEGDMKNAVIFQNFSAGYKKIEGMTIDEQITRTAKVLKRQMQSVIDIYIREQELLTNIKLDEVATWIETTLGG